MKLSVLQESLAKALTISSRFASSKVQLPVLANVLLKTDKNKLVISATNLETSVSLAVGAKIEKEGEITVPSKVITEIVANLNSGQINLSAEKELLTVTTPYFESSITGMNASDFPSTPSDIGDDFITLNAGEVDRVLEKLLFAVSSDLSRPVLTGVLVMLKDGLVSFVATDGFRLSQKVLNVAGLKGELQTIVPKQVLAELSRLSGGEEDFKFSVRKNDGQVVFAISGITITSKIIEGDFPEFGKIIPKSTNIKLQFDKDDFAKSMKLASVYSRDSANVVKLGILEDKVEIYSESNQIGTQKTKIETKVENNLSKESFVIAYNYRFVEEFLNTVEGESVEIDIVDSNSPSIFRDPEDKDFLHIIMPIRLTS